MARRDLLTDEEREQLFGVPGNHDALVRLYTLSGADFALAVTVVWTESGGPKVTPPTGAAATAASSLSVALRVN